MPGSRTSSSKKSSSKKSSSRKSSSRKSSSRKPGSRHKVRFPGESATYRAARDKLLDAEIEMRRTIESVAAQRRNLPAGGQVPQDYVFEEIVGADGTGTKRKVRMSELFAEGKDSLILYNFMYGPEMPSPCPSCTSILDGLDGEAQQKGEQMPALNVFVRRNGKISHFYNTELMFAGSDPGEDPRHVDMIWPLWNLFDVTPEGRGAKWNPKLSY